jgi:hypothetical protein
MGLLPDWHQLREGWRREEQRSFADSLLLRRVLGTRALDASGLAAAHLFGKVGASSSNPQGRPMLVKKFPSLPGWSRQFSLVWCLRAAPSPDSSNVPEEHVNMVPGI